MKKFLIILLLLSPVYADDFSSMSIEEYSRFFEMGLVQDETEDDVIEDTSYKPTLKGKIDDIITPDNLSIEHKTNKTGFFDSYKETYIEPTTKNDIFENGNFSVFSNNTKEKSDYMTNNLKQTINAKYNFGDKFSLQTGHETWYVNQDANLGARKIYFNPKINLSKQFNLDYASRYNYAGNKMEQELGLNYIPSFLKNNAIFGVKASGVYNLDNTEKSNRLKFTTDLFIF